MEDSIIPLKVLAFVANFERYTHDDQLQVLENMLKSDTGKEIVNKIIFEHECNKLFNICVRHKNVLRLLQTSIDAQKHLVTLSSCSLEEIFGSLNTWFRSIPDDKDFKVYVSDDKKLICMQNPNIRVDRIEIEGVFLTRDDFFDFETYIYSREFDSDNIYIHKMSDGKLTSYKWWEFYTENDF